MCEFSQGFSYQLKIYREISPIPLRRDFSMPGAEPFRVLGNADSDEDSENQESNFHGD